MAEEPQPEPWPEGAVPMQTHFEALLEEQGRAMQLAADEREKAASALRESLAERIDAGDSALERHITEQIAAIRAALDAQHHLAKQTDDSAKELIEAHFASSKEALRTAEQEREKTAQALRDSLAESVHQGDRQLVAHIDAQIESVRLALVAAKELSDQRHESSQVAVEKAFSASTELALKHNDLIAAADRDREKFATDADIAHLRENLDKVEAATRGNIRRDVFGQAMGEWQTWRNQTDVNLTSVISRKEYEKVEADRAEWRERVEKDRAEWQRAIETRLNLQEGQREGVGLSARSVAMALGTLLGFLTLLFTILAANGVFGG